MDTAATILVRTPLWCTHLCCDMAQKCDLHGVAASMSALAVATPVLSIARNAVKTVKYNTILVHAICLVLVCVCATNCQWLHNARCYAMMCGSRHNEPRTECCNRQQKNVHNRRLVRSMRAREEEHCSE
eukprot:6485717-Amphidinium_carterae.1